MSKKGQFVLGYSDFARQSRHGEEKQMTPSVGFS
jgi:hypothetical protein